MSEGAEQPVCFECRILGRRFPCRKNDVLDKQRLAECYVAMHRAVYGPGADPQRSEALTWAWECLIHLAADAPDMALDIILLALPLLRDDDDNQERRYLAAGPLQDLIVQNGPAVIGRVEAEAARNPDFRLLLSGTWRQGTGHMEMWRRIQLAIKDGPRLDDNAHTPLGGAGFTIQK